MTDAAKFWDRAAPKYARDPIADLPAYEYTRGRTMSYLSRESRVRELGCGTGSTALELAPHLGHITGTDLSQGMIDIARDKATAQGIANADFRVAPASGALDLDGSFDVVMAHNLLHLLPDPAEVITRVHDVLPPGGLFISKTPCLADRAFGLKRYPIRAVIPLMQLFGKAPHVTFLTQPQLERMVTGAGFEIVEAGNFPATSRYIVARKP